MAALHYLIISCTLLLSCAKPRTAAISTSSTMNKYIGMWVTGDGYIRQELLPNGRYDEARGQKQSAYTGRYEINGDHIQYWDDTGFTADGTFRGNDTLHHGGYIFYREKPKQP
ncbi:Atu4866 domain-containing protein [Chitinophaga sp. XS-30]|uniref:Atu4866 domain-containing protein n=1 Tax=Chitinophaga sp. XS-30 TaxID=2604421 RepID=UPI0011DCCA05|nr:Atu4866 domain-containing protein [Chitinophaga sp. XS-30]QEH43176.1 hypothetical protein FW415_20810 [Chitinophaga sp. XS-30]